MNAGRGARRAARAETRRLRRRRRAERRAARRTVDLLPPEGVPIRFELAGLGARLAAQLTDILLTLLFIVAFLAFLAATLEPPGSVIVSLGALLFFAVRAPYYVLAELLWNGQTIGKRMMRLRVVGADGRALTTHAVVVRNLMKEAEVFVPGTYLVASPALDWVSRGILLAWIAGLLAVPILNRRRQRLGDIIAHTCVIQQPVALLMSDLAAVPVRAARTRFAFLPHQLDHYGAYELQTLEALLHASQRAATGDALTEQRQANLRAVADRIRAKIDYPEPVGADEAEAFLRAFYTAQRLHLEQRQLFGERRADKYYRQGEERPGAGAGLTNR